MKKIRWGTTKLPDIQLPITVTQRERLPLDLNLSQVLQDKARQQEKFPKIKPKIAKQKYRDSEFG